MGKRTTAPAGQPLACHAGDAMGFAAPFPAADPGAMADLGAPWECLGWLEVSDPWPRIDITFLEALNPAVRAVLAAAEAARGNPGLAASYALVLESYIGTTRMRMRCFVPQAKPSAVHDGEIVRVTFTADPHAAFIIRTLAAG